MNAFDITGHHAIVVGAGGIGGAVARGLAEHGAHVAVADVDEARAERVAGALRGADREALGLPADVTDEASVRAMVAAVAERFPRIDILVNAAGITVRKRAEDVSVQEWRHILDVNATGSFICCQAVGELMARQGGGAIVNLSSVRGRFGARFGQTEYSASKGAVDALTRSLAAQWAELGIRVNAVAPTFVETDLTRGVLADRGVRRRAALQHPHGTLGRGSRHRRSGAVPGLPGGPLRHRPGALHRRRSDGSHLVRSGRPG